MTDAVQTIEASVQKSHSGVDDGSDYQPAEKWVPLVDAKAPIQPKAE